MNFAEIAVLAQKSGYDLITVEAMGPQTIVTCERRMSAKKEPWVEELDVNFSDIERTALEELTQAGLDARFTSKGIRAYGQQSTRLDDICDAPHTPRHMPHLGITSTFEPSGIHRKDFNVEPEKPKQPKYRYYPIY